MVRPQHAGELFNPSFHNGVKLSLQRVLDDGLDSAICLQLSVEKYFFYVDNSQKFGRWTLSNYFSLLVIMEWGIPDLHMMDFHVKLVIFLFSNLGKWIRFSPLSEVVNPNDGEFDSSHYAKGQG